PRWAACNCAATAHASARPRKGARPRGEKATDVATPRPAATRRSSRTAARTADGRLRKAGPQKTRSDHARDGRGQRVHALLRRFVAISQKEKRTRRYTDRSERSAGAARRRERRSRNRQGDTETRRRGDRRVIVSPCAFSRCPFNYSAKPQSTPIMSFR